MIFIGDIAHPHGCKPSIKNAPKGIFKNTVANLEGAIVKPDDVSNKEYKLFNSEEVVDFFKQIDVVSLTMANNHITDVGGFIGNTCEHLDKYNISYCGAGRTLKEAQNSTIIIENNQQYAILSYGWDVIGCIYAKKSSEGVNPLTVSNIRKTITETRIQYPDAKIIISLHWDYELALYPMPINRQLARIAIDVGASMVIGHHSHRVQGYEIYKGCPILYGIGNWFIPDEEFLKGKLIYPKVSKKQIALEIKKDDIVCHWFIYDNSKQTIEYIKSEKLLESEFMKEISPYGEMELDKYESWYKKNRIKKILLPYFKDINSIIEMKTKKILLLTRQKFIFTLLLIGLKKPRLRA